MRTGRAVGAIGRVVLAAALGLAAVEPVAAQRGEDLGPVYEALGLPSLAEAVEGGFQGAELRVRTSVSYTVPHTLVVVRRGAGGEWNGHVWRWSGGLDLSDPEAPRRRGSCDDTDFREAFVCEAEAGRRVDWASVGSLVFDSIDVMTLPDPSELPPSRFVVLDGLYLQAEMADSGSYRSVRWGNHEARDHPAARRALELHHLTYILTGGCATELPPPWTERVERIYRGLPREGCPERREPAREEDVGPADGYGCRATAPVADSILRKAEAACAEALRRLEVALAITPVPLEFVIVEADHEGEEDGERRASPFVRLASFDQLPWALEVGLVGHESAHLAVFEWLDVEASGPLGADSVYGTFLPDILDDGLAILGEPDDARRERRRHLTRIDVPTLDAVLRMAHPRGAESPVPEFRSRRRRTLEPCAECPSPPFLPERWVLIKEERAEPGGEVIEADTTYWTERPPEPEVDETTRFYALSEVTISFLQHTLGEPEELRDYVLSLMEAAPVKPHAMAALSERMGEPPGVIEERWRRWIAERRAEAGR